MNWSKQNTYLKRIKVMDKQGRITNISEVKIGGEYRWKKGRAIDADRIIVTEKPEGKPYLVTKVNGLRINLWHWRGRLMPWTNNALSDSHEI